MSTFSRTSREVLHDFSFFSVIRDTVEESTQNETFTRNSVAHIGAVAIVPIMDNGDVVLIKQYRSTIDQESLEVVAGRRDVKNEDLEVCALRELREELGIEAKSITTLGWAHTSPGFTDEQIYLYMGTVCSELEMNEPDGIEEQLAQSIRVPMSQALEWIADGTITDAKSIIALYRAAAVQGVIALNASS